MWQLNANITVYVTVTAFPMAHRKDDKIVDRLTQQHHVSFEALNDEHPARLATPTFYNHTSLDAYAFTCCLRNLFLVLP